MTGNASVLANVCGYQPEPTLIIENSREAFCFAEIPEAGLEFPQRKERIAQAEAKINRLLHRLARFWETGERRQRLLEAQRRLAVG